MTSDIITIKNSSPKDVNKIKKETGSAMRIAGSKELDLGVFDFGKKILFHPEKIAAYKNGERPFPTTVEIDLTNRCNHRCSFCFYAEHIGVEADKPSLKTELIKKRIKEAKELGTRSIGFTGGGEPTLHKDYLELIEFVHGIGLAVGTITNGSAITKQNAERYVKNLEWIRVSMAGGDRESYAKVQGVDQFELIMKNIEILSNKKEEMKSSLNIGIRTLVTPDNISTLEGFANRIKDLNIGYYQLAPDQYTDDKGKFWNSKKTQSIFKNIKPILAKKGISLLTTTYMTTQENLDYPQTCYAHFFMVTISAEGNLNFCKNARGEEKYNIGNINEKSLKEIWQDYKTKDIEKWVRPNNCGLFCKNMGINNTMEELMHPPKELYSEFVG